MGQVTFVGACGTVTGSCTRTLVTPLRVGQSYSFVCQGNVVTEPPSGPRVNTASGNPRARFNW